MAPQETANTKSSDQFSQSQVPDETGPSELDTSESSGSDGDDDLYLNLDLEEFIPDDKDVDFDQYAEQIKETAQKGAKQNLKQQVENASEPSDIDLEGLKQDLTQEIRDTAGDVAPPDKEGIGREQEGSEEEDAEEESRDEESRDEDNKDEAETTEGAFEDVTEAQDEEDDDVDSILDSNVARPSPPTSAEGARRYDPTTDALYVQKNACKRVVMDVKEVQSNLDILGERLSRIDADNDPAQEGKNLMSEIQRKLLDLENNLFEEDTL